MIIHELKTINPYFNDIWNGYKSFEVRLNDRDFKLGDLLLLKEYDKDYDKSLREILCRITYIFDNSNFVKDGFIIMEISILIKK